MHDIRGGVRSSIRNLFGACDIAEAGGVDFLVNNVSDTSERLFPRKSAGAVLKKEGARATETVDMEGGEGARGKSGKDDASSINPQAERMTTLLHGETPPRLATKSAVPNMEGIPLTENQKKRLYLEKLKKVSLKHL